MVGTDALLTILENTECQELLRAALEKSLRENPLKFYIDIIMPRSARLVSVPSSLQEYATMTPSQEAKMMDRLTTGFVQTTTTKIMLAEDFLSGIFEESGDKEISSQEVFKLAAEENININNIYLAARKLNIKRRRTGRRKDAKTFWYLDNEPSINNNEKSVRRS